VSTELLIRIVVLLVAVWTAISGVVLLGFHGASTGALGAGLTDEAAQRLLGAQLLVIVPVYLLIAVRLDRYRGLFWLPCASQAAVVLVVGYNMLKGDTDIQDGILTFAVSLIFVALLAFVWISERRMTALMQMEQQPGDSGGRPPARPDTQQ
jgi:hypothetical protein